MGISSFQVEGRAGTWAWLYARGYRDDGLRIPSWFVWMSLRNDERTLVCVCYEL